MQCKMCDIRTKPPICMVSGCPTEGKIDCAIVRLQGATERLRLILKHRSKRNYEAAMKSVEAAIKEMRNADQ